MAMTRSVREEYDNVSSDDAEEARGTGLEAEVKHILDYCDGLMSDT